LDSYILPYIICVKISFFYKNVIIEYTMDLTSNINTSNNLTIVPDNTINIIEPDITPTEKKNETRLL